LRSRPARDSVRRSRAMSKPIWSASRATPTRST
jgi:hypothetical protein